MQVKVEAEAKEVVLAMQVVAAFLDVEGAAHPKGPTHADPFAVLLPILLA